MQSIAPYIQLKRLPDVSDAFETLLPPWRARQFPLPYGGTVTAVGLQAAFQTLDPAQSRALYSLSGTFLGAARDDVPLRCRVDRIRDTRSFSTRLVSISQLSRDSDAERNVMILIADFIDAPPAGTPSLVDYSVPPRTADVSTLDIDSLPTWRDILQKRVDRQSISQAHADIFHSHLDAWTCFWHVRPGPNSVYVDYLAGTAPDGPSAQEHLPLHERFLSEFARLRYDTRESVDRLNMTRDALPISFHSLQACAIAWALDGRIADLPLYATGRPFQDAAACASLDFSYRIATNTPDLTQWHLIEISSVVGKLGRNQGEARLFDARGDVVAVCTMSGILRPKTTSRL